MINNFCSILNMQVHAVHSQWEKGRHSCLYMSKKLSTLMMIIQPYTVYMHTWEIVTLLLVYQGPPWAHQTLDPTWPADSAVCSEPPAILVYPSVFPVSLRSPASESESAAQPESTVKKNHNINS